jgi:hypothetical protein
MPTDPIVDGLATELLALAPMELELGSDSVFTIAAIMQLALRHPHLPPHARERAERFLAGARAYFAEYPTVLEAMRRGDDPAFDARPS